MIDIDAHHGNGVDEAFYTNNRVMTVSFHKYENIYVANKVIPCFPPTGHQDHSGCGDGRGYSVNVPLNDGIDNDTYWSMFKPIIDKVMKVFNPHAADSLAGDMLGPFNLTIKGHGRCVNYI
ncbi:unnamed protein product [Linum trigynum]|uniref:Histone deacetylase domain-containing protein n=1 Tax=Linum trigynum TaxID=586398 RepID=A0AAV2GGB8_9ROSI